VKTLTMTIAALVLSTVAAFAWPIVPFHYHAPGRTLGEQPRAFWDYAPASVAKDGMHLLMPMVSMRPSLRTRESRPVMI
jgi:hypothetical protein